MCDTISIKLFLYEGLWEICSKTRVSVNSLTLRAVLHVSIDLENQFNKHGVKKEGLWNDGRFRDGR